VIPVRRPKAHAGAVVEPQPSAFGLFLWHFEAFLPPETLDPFVIDSPSHSMQQLRHPTIPVPTVLRGQRHHVFDEPGFIIRHVPLTALG
jgi:hypothetical protein